MLKRFSNQTDGGPMIVDEVYNNPQEDQYGEILGSMYVENANIYKNLFDDMRTYLTGGNSGNRTASVEEISYLKPISSSKSLSQVSENSNTSTDKATHTTNTESHLKAKSDCFYEDYNIPGWAAGLLIAGSFFLCIIVPAILVCN